MKTANGASQANPAANPRSQALPGNEMRRRLRLPQPTHHSLPSKAAKTSENKQKRAIAMYPDSQLLPISALQHLIFCERQCALIHVEQLWAENVLTVQGRHLHDKAHDGQTELRGNLRITRSLWLKSNELGLIGQADIVEFHANGRVTPIEYKRGKPKKDDSDRVQICAQAMCLEHMLDTKIDAGQLFYGKRQRRSDVIFDRSLRQRTQVTINRLREIIQNHETPKATRQPKCDQCSLLDLCLPDCLRLNRGVQSWNDRQYLATENMACPETDDFDTLDESHAST